MLNLSFAGTLGADPETRQAGGSEVTEFRVAVNGYDRKAKAKTTTWLKVTIWGKRGVQLAGIAAKGSRVSGAGAFEVQEYTTRDGEVRTSYAVTVQDLTLQSFVDREEQPAAKGRKPAAAPVDDDEIPF